MAKIFLADDEKEIRDIVKTFLENDGYTVEAFSTGDLLFEAFQKKPCDLVLLDIMMPGSDGMEILQKIRAISTVPVILLTAKDTDSDLYNGLFLGSDDYLIKPFKPMILLAKINALLRRVQYEKNRLDAAAETDLVFGNLQYNARKKEFTIQGVPISLTPTETKFLKYMLKHQEETVSKEELMNQVWGMQIEIESRAVDETNRRLRKKLTAAKADVYVQTVWGQGLKLIKKEDA